VVKHKFLFAVLAILIGLQPIRLSAADTTADPAVRQIESFYATLLDTMKRGDQLGLQGRHLKLTPITEEIFDLAAMAQLSVGPSWPSLSESEKQGIVEAFKRMTIASYAKNFAKFAGEQFLVEPLVKTRNSDKIVESKLLSSDSSSDSATRGCSSPMKPIRLPSRATTAERPGWPPSGQQARNRSPTYRNAPCFYPSVVSHNYLDLYLRRKLS